MPRRKSAPKRVRHDAQAAKEQVSFVHPGDGRRALAAESQAMQAAARSAAAAARDGDAPRAKVQRTGEAWKSAGAPVGPPGAQATEGNAAAWPGAGMRRRSASPTPVPALAIQMGCARLQGKRSAMEDMIHTIPNLAGDVNQHYMGVYDGHAGEKAAVYAKTVLPWKCAVPSENGASVLRNAIRDTNNEFLAMARTVRLKDGSTCTCALFSRDKVHIGNLGDSRGVLGVYPMESAFHSESGSNGSAGGSTGTADTAHLSDVEEAEGEDVSESETPAVAGAVEEGKEEGKEEEEEEKRGGRAAAKAEGESGEVHASALGVRVVTEEHNCKLEGEVERITAEGGFAVTLFGQQRLLGVLAVTRALGDVEFVGMGLGNEPHIHTVTAESGLFYVLVLASDGLWDVMDNEQVMQAVYVNRKRDPTEIASALCQRALAEGSSDNVSVAIAFFHRATAAQGAAQP